METGREEDGRYEEMKEAVYMDLNLKNDKQPKENQDAYLSAYLEAVRSAKTDADLKDIINKIYSDGFEDGVNNA